jgi:hypothetical protein
MSENISSNEPPGTEHEWKVWKDVKLPDGKILIPGVVSHASNVVEHPELVADRIALYAVWLARERYSGNRLRAGPARASADCLGQAEGAYRRGGHGEQTPLERSN